MIMIMDSQYRTIADGGRGELWVRGSRWPAMLEGAHPPGHDDHRDGRDRASPQEDLFPPACRRRHRQVRDGPARLRGEGVAGRPAGHREARSPGLCGAAHAGARANAPQRRREWSRSCCGRRLGAEGQGPSRPYSSSPLRAEIASRPVSDSESRRRCWLVSHSARLPVALRVTASTCSICSATART